MGVRMRIGVMMPSTHTTCAADLPLTAPPGVTIHGQRLWRTNDAKGEVRLERIQVDIARGARALATARVDGIASGGTTGSFYQGPGGEKEMLARLARAAGVPAVAPSPAVLWRPKTLRGQPLPAMAQ
jgi:maleate isomerase